LKGEASTCVEDAAEIILAYDPNALPESTKQALGLSRIRRITVTAVTVRTRRLRADHSGASLARRGDAVASRVIERLPREQCSKQEAVLFRRLMDLGTRSIPAAVAATSSVLPAFM